MHKYLYEAADGRLGTVQSQFCAAFVRLQLSKQLRLPQTSISVRRCL